MKMGTMWEVCRDVERQRWSGGGGSAGGLTTVYKLAICIEWMGRGDINSGVSPLHSVRTVLGGKNEDEGATASRSRWWGPEYYSTVSPTRSTYCICRGGVFESSSTELVLKLYDMIGILSCRRDQLASLHLTRTCKRLSTISTAL